MALLILCCAPRLGVAQGFQAESAYSYERGMITTTLETVVAMIQEATVNQEGGLTERLRQLTDRLKEASRMSTATPSDNTGELDELGRILEDVAAQMAALREELEAEESYELASKLAPLERDIERAVKKVDRMLEDEAQEGSRKQGRWLKPGRYETTWRNKREESRQEKWGDEEDEEGEDEEDYEEDTEEDDDHPWRRRMSKGWHKAGTFVGEYAMQWPYGNETALYQTIPAIRYNRVEGFVLGVGRGPMGWERDSRANLYGQAGYAFALDEWRYEIGLEARIDQYRRHDDNYEDFGLKIGGSYRRNTDTQDHWKVSWIENSLAAFFFENDFFDYYQVEGWTVYGIQRITPYAQVSAGYRQEDYQSLENNTSWSLFGGDGFYFNPAIDEGRMQSFLVTFEGGRVADLSDLPRGFAFRLEAEFGEGTGGDFSFNRYIGDTRFYLPMGDFSSLGLRLRGGLTSGDTVPIQKHFAIGGIGSVRAYPTNGFSGTRMLLGNAEYILDDVLFDGMQLIGLADIGWVNTPGTNRFDFDDTFSSIGFGLGLDDRSIRLELAWPLRDFGGDQDPALWLRITPNF